MNSRDKAIVADLVRFRCMTRDDIAALHFNTVKHPITHANIVLKRLRRDGIIDCSKEWRQYVYFPIPSIKKDSAKINHFLAIVDFYKQLHQHEPPMLFVVEPKYGKGNPEPDVFMIWQRTPMFVEIQRSIYSDKVMKEKFSRYTRYYHDEQWKLESWQPQDKKVFPRVWIVSETKYNIDAPFKVAQSTDVRSFLASFAPSLKEGGKT
ncbi:replication-relaxation family protein [Paenibacillus silvisoli]|uniref:replication-relaxation family protein n=1 Tax=Paenibacillus silvisoli TaxID=3110539 RepID=UPI002805859C|nr:replication-relaxation family protein [Paenibacillus silvisoli]